MSTRINLFPELFHSVECVILQHEPFSVSAFCYPSGVCALRMRNDKGELIMLPFQGMQIWSARFNGRELTMKSMFEAPHLTRVYLENYGGFLLHCGATAMGVPTGEDNHPLHGELPNAPYDKVYLILDEDDKGIFLGLGGTYQHTVAFSCNYLAEPLVKLYSGSSVFKIEMSVSNLKNTPMEFMYLAHINFRPVVDGRLVYSAECTPDTVRVRTSIPSHVQPGPGYKEFLTELQRNPEKHHILRSDLMFDPEVVFIIDYLADSEGWAHTLQVHPDGASDYVAHRPAQLNKGVRWICRTADQEALGMVLPATAEPEGYHAEKAKGNIKTIPPREKYYCEILAGTLMPEETQSLESKIIKLITQA